VLTADSLRIPKSWEIIAGADTGTFMGGVICAIDPKFELYVLEEFPNYHYTGDGTIELNGMTVAEWIRWFSARLKRYTGKPRNTAWVDANTTFKTEVGHGFGFRMNRKLLDLRTEITREYLRNGRMHLMPWLKVVPYEMEEAKYPEHESESSGRYVRLKNKDHCLDGVEHICSRRPHPTFEESQARKQSPIRELVAKTQQLGQIGGARVDPHMGSQ
jgi:hypothetical protein